jgi:hypothetical protein
VKVDVRTTKTQIMIANLISRILFSDQTEYDSYNATFSEIVSLLTEVLELQPVVGESRPMNHSLASRVVSTLWIRGIRCRHKVIRRNIIELLVKYPRREVLWDGLFFAYIIKFVMDHQEQYLESDKVVGGPGYQDSDGILIERNAQDN